MRQHGEEAERLGLGIVVVTFETQERGREYARAVGLRWPLLIDRRRALYEAYGMGRGRRASIWGPATWWAYARLIGRGRRLRRSTDDIYQLGGDVLVDPAGGVALHHVGKGPADRPAVRALFAVIGAGPAR